MRKPLLVALAFYVAGAALFAGIVAVPFLDKQRDTPTAVPSPSPLVATALDILDPAARLCMTDVAISAQSEQVRFMVGTYHKPGPPLLVTIRGEGFAGSERVAGGYDDNVTLAVPVPRPSSSRLVTVCIRNAGRRKIALYAAEDRAQSRVNVFLNGERANATPTLHFHEAGQVTIAGRAGVTAGRIAVFRGFLDHAWVVWALALLGVCVLPVLLAAALAAAFRDQFRTTSSGE